MLHTINHTKERRTLLCATILLMVGPTEQLGLSTIAVVTMEQLGLQEDADVRELLGHHIDAAVTATANK